MNNNFSSWVLTVVGVVLISVIIEMILPKGNISKFIKSIFAIFIVFVMINPIIMLKDTNFLENMFNTNSIEINEEYIKKINEKKITEYENNIVVSLTANGYCNTEVEIEAEIAREIKINKVYVNICNLVLSEKLEHIDKYTNMVAIIKNMIEVKEGDIVFNE